MNEQSDTLVRAEYYDEVECARVLELAPITLAVWRMQRKGPPVTKLGRRVLYRKASVKAWLEAKESAPRTYPQGAHAPA